MRNYLLDIVQHTQTLGNIDLTKITGTPTETTLDASADDRTVIVHAVFKEPIPNFVGQFGLPNLSKLNTLLNIPEYNNGAKITVETADRAGIAVPCALNFINAAGDFKNNYRFMSEQIVNEKLKAMKFNGASWDVEFQPTLANIQRLKYQAQAHNGELTFVAATSSNNDLVFSFGDHSSHAGSFTFQTGVTGSLRTPWAWPIGAVQTILSLTGDKQMSFSNSGAAQITVDSGLAVYTYIMPGMGK